MMHRLSLRVTRTALAIASNRAESGKYAPAQSYRAVLTLQCIECELEYLKKKTLRDVGSRKVSLAYMSLARLLQEVFSIHPLEPFPLFRQGPHATRYAQKLVQMHVHMCKRRHIYDQFLYYLTFPWLRMV